MAPSLSSMPSSSSAPNPITDPQAFKLAVAVALFRFQKQQEQRRGQPPPPSSSSSADDAQRWRRKSKERKRELIRLREEIKQLNDGGNVTGLVDAVPQVVSCKCHFFDDCGQSGPKRVRLVANGRESGDDADDEHWIDEVLRRRFLRHVRWNERRKRPDGSGGRHLLESNTEDEMEQLSTSTDFLVALSDNPDKGDTSFATLSHQAVDFTLASVKRLLSLKKDQELVEEITNGLIMRLTKRMCIPSGQDESSGDGSGTQFYVQHLLRRLGHDPYIGQRIMLSVSQRICVLADSLLLMDPFDDSFPNTYDWMFMMIQLIEFMISDNIQAWTGREDFDNRLLEEWLRSILRARNVLELLECRNGLYILYMERIVGELAKHLGPLSQQLKFDVDILSSLFC